VDRKTGNQFQLLNDCNSGQTKKQNRTISSLTGQSMAKTPLHAWVQGPYPTELRYQPDTGVHAAYSGVRKYRPNFDERPWYDHRGIPGPLTVPGVIITC
jgi:hypothetical protein